MICGEDVPTKRNRDNNQHEKFGVVLNGLEDDKFVVDNGETFLTDIIAVSGV